MYCISDKDVQNNKRKSNSKSTVTRKKNKTLKLTITNNIKRNVSVGGNLLGKYKINNKNVSSNKSKTPNKCHKVEISVNDKSHLKSVNPLEIKLSNKDILSSKNKVMSNEKIYNKIKLYNTSNVGIFSPMKVNEVNSHILSKRAIRKSHEFCAKSGRNEMISLYKKSPKKHLGSKYTGSIKKENKNRISKLFNCKDNKPITLFNNRVVKKRLRYPNKESIILKCNDILKGCKLNKYGNSEIQKSDIKKLFIFKSRIGSVRRTRSLDDLSLTNHKTCRDIKHRKRIDPKHSVKTFVNDKRGMIPKIPNKNRIRSHPVKINSAIDSFKENYKNINFDKFNKSNNKDPCKKVALSNCTKCRGNNYLSKAKCAEHESLINCESNVKLEKNKKNIRHIFSKRSLKTNTFNNKPLFIANSNQTHAKLNDVKSGAESPATTPTPKLANGLGAVYRTEKSVSKPAKVSVDGNRYVQVRRGRSSGNVESRRGRSADFVQLRRGRSSGIMVESKRKGGDARDGRSSAKCTPAKSVKAAEKKRPKSYTETVRRALNRSCRSVAPKPARNGGSAKKCTPYRTRLNSATYDRAVVAMRRTRGAVAAKSKAAAVKAAAVKSSAGGGKTKVAKHRKSVVDDGCVVNGGGAGSTGVGTLSQFDRTSEWLLNIDESVNAGFDGEYLKANIYNSFYNDRISWVDGFKYSGTFRLADLVKYRVYFGVLKLGRKVVKRHKARALNGVASTARTVPKKCSRDEKSSVQTKSINCANENKNSEIVKKASTRNNVFKRKQKSLHIKKVKKYTAIVKSKNTKAKLIYKRALEHKAMMNKLKEAEDGQIFRRKLRNSSINDDKQTLKMISFKGKKKLKKKFVFTKSRTR